MGATWYPSEALVPWDKHLSQHQWHAALIPQCTAGQAVSCDWGGSADAVTTQLKHPEAVAIFASFISESNYEMPYSVTPTTTGGLFPASTDGFKISEFNAPIPTLDNQTQTANKDIFAVESKRVDPTSEVTKATNGSES